MYVYVHTCIRACIYCMYIYIYVSCLHINRVSSKGTRLFEGEFISDDLMMTTSINRNPALLFHVFKHIRTVSCRKREDKQRQTVRRKSRHT